jgi:hypothetical protein
MTQINLLLIELFNTVPVIMGWRFTDRDGRTIRDQTAAFDAFTEKLSCTISATAANVEFDAPCVLRIDGVAMDLNDINQGTR